MLHIIIVDGDRATRRRLAAHIAQESDILLVGEAGDGRAGVGLAARTHPDVVVMDVDAPVMDGIHASRLIKTAPHFTRIVGLSRALPAKRKEAFLKAGAEVCVSKSQSMTELIDAIRGRKP